WYAFQHCQNRRLIEICKPIARDRIQTGVKFPVLVRAKAINKLFEIHRLLDVPPAESKQVERIHEPSRISDCGRDTFIHQKAYGVGEAPIHGFLISRSPWRNKLRSFLPRITLPFLRVMCARFDGLFEPIESDFAFSWRRVTGQSTSDRTRYTLAWY